MNWLQQALYNLFMPVFDQAFQRRVERVEVARNYREGLHRRQIAQKYNAPDDNITVNYTGLIIDKSISMLLGDDVRFDLPGDNETPEDEYIQAVWTANKKSITLMKAAYNAADCGTGYIKLQPNGVYHDGTPYTRLIVLDPQFITMDVNPEDMEQVLRYTIQYVITGVDGKEKARKEVIELVDGAVDAQGFTSSLHWEISEHEASNSTGGRWVELSREVWGYDFPPIVHWQNLPDPNNVYGIPDLTDDLIALQDRLNFVMGNITKIIRYHAHPKTWGRQLGNNTKTEWGADELVVFNSDNAMLANLEMQSDLASSLSVYSSLRQALFDIAQTVDLGNIKDKVGALTNFGLRVIYQDALARIGVKRELLGEALEEINRRLLIIGGFANTDPGEVVWEDPLPVNDQEQVTALQAELNMGVVSKQTVSESRGHDWQTEQERMDAEKAAGDNIGAALLNAFNRGG